MEVHFNMSKLTREQKKEIYEKRKQGRSVSSLSKEYAIHKRNVENLIRLLDKHGEDILRKDKNRYYSPVLKEEIINKVLVNHQSVKSTAIEYGLLSNGMLTNWIKSYKEHGYVIVEKPKGRPKPMTKKINLDQEYNDMTPEEKVKYLENKNLYLEAEVEYLKKLRAVVQARKNQQPKKK